MARDLDVGNNVPKVRPAIEQFSIDYDMPLSLATKLIGRTESETAANIQAMVDYLTAVIAAHDDYYRENGWPMQGQWKPTGTVHRERGAS
ncbi:MAG: hypothetical protein WC057_06490 [Dehalococcoidales bacterium]